MVGRNRSRIACARPDSRLAWRRVVATFRDKARVGVPKPALWRGRSRVLSLDWVLTVMKRSRLLFIGSRGARLRQLALRSAVPVQGSQRVAPHVVLLLLLPLCFPVILRQTSLVSPAV